MNKSEVVNKIAYYSNLSKADAALALGGLIETVTNALAENQQVHITGFGTFKISDTNESTYVQNKTEHMIKLAGKNGVDFQPGWLMKRKVDPATVKPIYHDKETPENNLAILITIRAMVRANNISDLKRIENNKPIIKVIKLLPTNAYTLTQWLIAGQFLTDFSIEATNKAGVVNQILYELSSRSIVDILRKAET